MTIRPYTISDWQARAIAEDRLGLIVMPLKVQPIADCIEPHAQFSNECVPWKGGQAQHSVVLPFALDDLLWCRETWALAGMFADQRGNCGFHNPRSMLKDDLRYRADGDGYDAATQAWRSPVTMPKWASRTTLRVLSVDVKRVQDTTEEEAKLTGCEPDGTFWWWGRGASEDGIPGVPAGGEAMDHFIVKFGEKAFDTNPWCAFGRVKVEKMNVGEV